MKFHQFGRNDTLVFILAYKGNKPYSIIALSHEEFAKTESMSSEAELSEFLSNKKVALLRYPTAGWWDGCMSAYSNVPGPRGVVIEKIGSTWNKIEGPFGIEELDIRDIPLLIKGKRLEGQLSLDERSSAFDKLYRLQPVSSEVLERENGLGLGLPGSSYRGIQRWFRITKHKHPKRQFKTIITA